MDDSTVFSAIGTIVFVDCKLLLLGLRMFLLLIAVFMPYLDPESSVILDLL